VQGLPSVLCVVEARNGDGFVNAGCCDCRGRGGWAGSGQPALFVFVRNQVCAGEGGGGAELARGCAGTKRATAALLEQSHRRRARGAPPPRPMAHITAILVAELPPLRNPDGTAVVPPPVEGGKPSGAASPLASAGGVQPRMVLTLPPAEAPKLPPNVLSFCFPDLDQLQQMPYQWDNTGDEFVFTITSRDAPRLHGFVRRYRVTSRDLGNRLDLSPFTAASTKVVATSTSWQCICILSERCVCTPPPPIPHHHT